MGSTSNKAFPLHTKVHYLEEKHLHKCSELGAALDFFHGIPFLLEKMADHSHSDLVIWQTFPQK